MNETAGRDRERGKDDEAGVLKTRSSQKALGMRIIAFVGLALVDLVLVEFCIDQNVAGVLLAPTGASLATAFVAFTFLGVRLAFVLTVVGTLYRVLLQLVARISGFSAEPIPRKRPPWALDER